MLTDLLHNNRRWAARIEREQPPAKKIEPDQLWCR